ncbi:unnamed protein product [Amoebophrya sp. A25]|nr:unnamed protein product [Amoebophrya sp. A25]|eukprot:GSA25T00012431001.1
MDGHRCQEIDETVAAEQGITDYSTEKGRCWIFQNTYRSGAKEYTNTHIFFFRVDFAYSGEDFATEEDKQKHIFAHPHRRSLFLEAGAPLSLPSAGEGKCAKKGGKKAKGKGVRAKAQAAHAQQVGDLDL